MSFIIDRERCARLAYPVAAAAAGAIAAIQPLSREKFVDGWFQFEYGAGVTLV